MEKNDNIIILRVDVDNPFIYRKNFFQKILNRVYGSHPNFPGRELMPGHLDALKTLLKIEEKFNARSTFFFRTTTVPTLGILKKLEADNHEIAYHADRTQSFQTFSEDLKKIQQKTSTDIIGVTKHGIAKHRSGGPWDGKKMIEYSHKANLKYLAQGMDHPDWEVPKIENGVKVFGHHKTIWSSDIDDLIHYVESNKWPMLMLHPEDFYMSGANVKEKLTKILSMNRAISVRDALSLMN